MCKRSPSSKEGSNFTLKHKKTWFPQTQQSRNGSSNAHAPNNPANVKPNQDPRSFAYLVPLTKYKHLSHHPQTTHYNSSNLRTARPIPRTSQNTQTQQIRPTKIHSIQNKGWKTNPLITIIVGVRGASHEHSIEQLSKLNLPKSSIKSLMKNLHENVVKYLTYLVLNERKLDNNKPPIPRISVFQCYERF